MNYQLVYNAIEATRHVENTSSYGDAVLTALVMLLEYVSVLEDRLESHNHPVVSHEHDYFRPIG